MKKPVKMKEKTDKPARGVAAGLIRDMAFSQLNKSEIARQVGVSSQYVSRVVSGFLGGHSRDELREFQENTADIYDSLKMRVLESLTPDKLSKMQAYPAIVSAGILHDKAALLRGQATSMNVNVLLDVASMIRRDEK